MYFLKYVSKESKKIRIESVQTPVNRNKSILKIVGDTQQRYFMEFLLLSTNFTYQHEGNPGQAPSCYSTRPSVIFISYKRHTDCTASFQRH